VQKDEPQRDCRIDGDTQLLLDESEHEQRRSTERFSRALIPPRALGRRNVNRKKRLGETSSRNNSEGDGNTSSKVNRLIRFNKSCRIQVTFIFSKFVLVIPMQLNTETSRFAWSFQWNSRGAFDSAKNHKRQRRKRQSVTAKREVANYKFRIG